MQNPVGEVMSMPAPQGLSVSGGNHGNNSYHGNQQTSAQPSITVTAQIEEAHSTTNLLSGQNSDEHDEDKKAIYKHPLFPLMALLLEKCEQATQTPDCPTCDSFDVDIQTFVHRQEQERRPFFSDDLELDGLMVKAIQVLRIHLLELEKVSELCKDFCSRYITCLKGKLQSENLLRSEMSGYDADTQAMDDCLSPGAMLSNNNNNNNNLQGLQNSNNINLVIQGQVNQQSASLPMGGLGQGQVISGGTVYQMVQTPQGLVAQPIQVQPTNQLNTQGSSVIHNNPMSQTGLTNTPDTPTQHSPNTPCLPKDFNFDDDDYGKRKNKRGILPKHATQVMKSWLFQHIVHPYPTEDEKRQIASQINLTMLQVNNWFINARRRILQPMLDASNPEGPKAKKSKPTQNRPVQRFWPENLANMSRVSGGGESSPTASESPTSTSSPLLHMDESYADDEDEDDDDEGPDTSITYNTSQASSNLHQPLLLHPTQVPVQGLGAGQLHQTSHVVSSTSSSAATLNLIADVAMGNIPSSSFLPIVGSRHGHNVMSSLSSVVANSMTGLDQEDKATMAAMNIKYDASNMTE